MGSWRITVAGHGCHHNGNPNIDADIAAQDFVNRLKQQGHTIESATFVLTSAETDLAREDTLKDLHRQAAVVEWSLNKLEVDQTLKDEIAQFAAKLKSAAYSGL